MEIISEIWTQGIIRPMINGLVLLYSVLFDNFGLSILSFTLIVRAVMIPLSVKQANQLKAMTALQPKLKELQGRYSKDRQRLSQETMRVYKEHGVNPLGCLGPMIIQLPIWIGLYQSLLKILPSTSHAVESLVRLSSYLYPWLPMVGGVIPLDSSFLWLDLAERDPTPILPILVGGSMFLMQKMTATPSVDPRQQTTNRMMLWMMPLMFGFFTLQFPSGLALYWVASNVAGILIQGFVTGWGPLLTLASFWRSHEPATVSEVLPTVEENLTDARDRDDGEDQRRSHRNRPKGARRRSSRRRNRRR